MSQNVVQVFETQNKIEISNDTTTVVIPQTEYVIQVTSPGPQGARGSGLLSGTSDPPPSDLGTIGDYYFYELDPYYVYGPKTETGWPATPFFQAATLTKRFVHSQTTASATWDITHDLGGRPSVSVVDSANSVVVGDVTYIDDSHIRIEFTGAFIGSAYLT